ncbi:hypothetical protein DERF_007277 [Dermatophagoides farinae]|uniref:Uncharacterized protein n=1 Tax=Dermatophagoides farinae TaxID=6954 RepID=A0A922I0R2_DERFA|nr:hypothetical protein DERF_007277 [Dermatophagoides farinae]
MVIARLIFMKCTLMGWNFIFIYVSSYFDTSDRSGKKIRSKYGSDKACTMHISKFADLWNITYP